jgi:hypothetical protein
MLLALGLIIELSARGTARRIRELRKIEETRLEEVRQAHALACCELINQEWERQETEDSSWSA